MYIRRLYDEKKYIQQLQKTEMFRIWYVWEINIHDRFPGPPSYFSYTKQFQNDSVRKNNNSFVAY